MYLIGWLSVRCLVELFLEFWSVQSFGPFFCLFVCLSWRVCHIKGRSFRCLPGLGNPHMWGRGLRRNNATCSTLCQFSVTSPTTHNQIGLFWCLFLGGWVCVLSRTPWVCPMNSPVRLGVSPTATSTTTGVLSQRLGTLFPHTLTLSCLVYLAPQLFLSVYLHTNVGLPSPEAAASLGPPATTLPAQSSSCCLAGSSPHLAAHLHPSYQSVWMFLL